VTKQGGEVLFISQRHLLTFDEVQDVPLVPDYELVFLMEMAMSDNATYMDAFHSDISSQRFTMIVSEPLVIQYQGRNHAFGEENDAWVEGVSEPVLCYYEPSMELPAAGVVLYTPRAAPCK
jgi:peroxiredoxin